MSAEELLQIGHGDPCQTRCVIQTKSSDSHTNGGRNMHGIAAFECIRNKYSPGFRCG